MGRLRCLLLNNGAGFVKSDFKAIFNTDQFCYSNTVNSQEVEIEDQTGNEG